MPRPLVPLKGVVVPEIVGCGVVCVPRSQLPLSDPFTVGKMENLSTKVLETGPLNLMRIRRVLRSIVLCSLCNAVTYFTDPEVH